MSKVKVRRVVENPTSGAPILLGFEHAQMNRNVNLSTRLVAGLYETDPKSVTQTKFYKPITNMVNPLKRKQLVIVQGETDMTYIGTSNSMLNNSTSNQLRTFLAVRHKNQFKIYQATPLTVSPYLNNRAHLNVNKKNEVIDQKIAAAKLIEAFGSKQKRLTYERKEANKINSKHMNESITTAAVNAELPHIMPDMSDNSVLTLAPPCNRDTKDVNAVYKLSDIISLSELDDMEDLAQGWLDSTDDQVKLWKESKQFSDYFFEMLQSLKLQRTTDSTVFRAKLVLYTELLICLLKLKYTVFRKKFLPLPTEFPSWLIDKVLTNFTFVSIKKIRCRPQSYKDKTCCYIMVLVLLTNNFSFDVQLMSTSLQIHITKLLTLARTVGITTKMNSRTKEYSGLLKLPLPKPIDRRGKTRKSIK